MGTILCCVPRRGANPWGCEDSMTADPFDFMLDYTPPTTTDHWALIGGPLPWDYEAVTYKNLQSGEVVTLTKDGSLPLQKRSHPACFSYKAPARFSNVAPVPMKRMSPVELSRTVPSFSRVPPKDRVELPEIDRVASAVFRNRPRKLPALQEA